MCQEKCPVKINTGELVKQLRSEEMAEMPRASGLAMVRRLLVGTLHAVCARQGHRLPGGVAASCPAARPLPFGWPSPTRSPTRAAQKVADNFGATAWAFNKLLNVVNVAHSVLGAAPLKAISGALNRWTGHMVPEWNPYMPKVRGRPARTPVAAGLLRRRPAGGAALQGRAGAAQANPLPAAWCAHERARSPTNAARRPPPCRPAPPLPQGAAPLNLNPPKPVLAEEGRAVPRKVVYVPACVTRIMGPAKGDYETGACLLPRPFSGVVCCRGGLPRAHPRAPLLTPAALPPHPAAPAPQPRCTRSC